METHPFFRRETMNSHGPQSSPGQLALDGATDEVTSKSLAATPQDCSDRPRTRSSPENPGIQVIGGTTYPEVAYNDSPSFYAEQDITEENDRRKRRKISLEPEQSIHEKIETEPLQNAWHTQLTQAASSFVDDLPQPQAVLQDSCPLTVQPISNVMDFTGESQIQRSVEQRDPEVTATHSSVPADINLSSHPSHLSRASTPTRISGPSDATSTSAAPDMSTPRKKTVRLGANGKLTNSPRRPPRRSPRSEKSGNALQTGPTPRPAVSSRKVEMKNGKFVSSFPVALAYRSAQCGKKIDKILSDRQEHPDNSTVQPQTKPKQVALGTQKTVHPFFSGKLKAKTQTASGTISETSSIAPASEDDAKMSSKPPKPWKDIVFGSRKSMQKLLLGLDPIWPPNALHNIQPYDHIFLPQKTPAITSKLKSKQNSSRVNTDEDTLRIFGKHLKSNLNQDEPLHLPTRTIMSGKTLIASLDSGSMWTPTVRNPVMETLKSRVLSTSSAFDRGMASGPQMWPQEYAPKCWQEVLQPNTQMLHDWLSNLQVHHVQTGKFQAKPKPTIQKKRRKRKSDEMDDFIAASDDDEFNNKQASKNAILLTGPPGCGKTASVYAVAHQLGFEVFEIHPGMRRNAKDILDKVGDMTQNHLVQQAAGVSSRRSSISVSDAEALPSLPITAPPNQQTMAAFMGKSKTEQKQNISDPKENKEAKNKQQKQSLILFEEVDTLFDEDKGFWSAVQSLIRTSKRPVILTCNNTETIPMHELDLYTTLEYESPAPDVATEYLQNIAAAEGHLLSSEAIRTLYLSKGSDLRASLTELNLWCQMTVGSKQGGLDWILPYHERALATSNGSVTRIVSQDTFINGHDVLPEVLKDLEELIRFAQDSLGISALDWVDKDVPSLDDTVGLRQLDDMLALSDARSAMDIFDDSISPLMASKIKQSSASSPPQPSRNAIVELFLANKPANLTASSICETLSSLAEEPRIGLPQPPGRKAPSLDTASASIVTDIAPYIRFIVSHDQNLEVLRNELGGGSQGSANKRQRRTRASRAALEGGTKANTRRDKWFPESLDFDAVLATGGAWQQAPALQAQESMGDVNSLGGTSPASSMDAA